MVMLSMLTWWYLDGLKDQFKRTKRVLSRVNDQFSIKLLLRTLFYPFRMIDADKNYGPSLSGKIQAWFDKLISCMIGGFIRTVVVIVGVIVLFFMLIVSVLRIVFWIILPILPIVVLLVSPIVLEMLGGVWT